MEPKIIGIIGKKRHGKDTIADYLVSNYGYIKVSFADTLKDVCRIVFGFSDKQLYSDEKEIIDDIWKILPRELFNFIGTDLMRNEFSKKFPHIGQDIWILSLLNKIKQNPDKKYVIPDIRFPNEYDNIKKLGGMFIKIHRPDIDDNNNYESEKYTDILEANFTIINNSTIDNIHKEIDNILK
jgi:hypothetical protein